MRDDFPEEVKRTVCSRVNSVCSNPDCLAPTSSPQDDPTKALNLGVAAHITSAAPGGPRFDASLSPDMRRQADNAIWLCQICAKRVDNDESQFPVSVLRAWRTLAEHRAHSSIGKPSQQVPESENQRKMRAILPWKGKVIVLSQMNTGRAVMLQGPKRGSSDVLLLDCDEFTVTIGDAADPRVIPLEFVTPSREKGRLEIQERYP